MEKARIRRPFVLATHGAKELNNSPYRKRHTMDVLAVCE